MRQRLRVPHSARMTLQSGHRALRFGRHSEIGRSYHITTTTAHRYAHFRNHAAAAAACAAIERSAIAAGARLWCWALMPDHLHLLLQLNTTAGLARVVHGIKAESARAANHALERRGRLWARAFHDRALREEENLRVVARYIIANPLRAGLVKHIGDYPYWNAVWLNPAPEHPGRPQVGSYNSEQSPSAMGPLL